MSPDVLFGVIKLVLSDNASDEHFEPATRNGSRAGFDKAAVADSARGHTRQTSPAWVDVV